MLSNIFVQSVDFKNSVPAASTFNEDGSYTIFLNSRLSREQQTNGYIHELKHILRLDLETRDNDVDILEFYAHKKINYHNPKFSN